MVLDAKAHFPVFGFPLLSLDRVYAPKRCKKVWPFVWPHLVISYIYTARMHAYCPPQKSTVLYRVLQWCMHARSTVCQAGDTTRPIPRGPADPPPASFGHTSCASSGTAPSGSTVLTIQSAVEEMHLKCLVGYCLRYIAKRYLSRYRVLVRDQKLF